MVGAISYYNFRGIHYTYGRSSNVRNASKQFDPLKKLVIAVRTLTYIYNYFFLMSRVPAKIKNFIYFKLFIM